MPARLVKRSMNGLRRVGIWTARRAGVAWQDAAGINGPRGVTDPPGLGARSSDRTTYAALWECHRVL